MNFEHEIIGFKDRGDKLCVDENVSKHGMCNECNECCMCWDYFYADLFSLDEKDYWSIQEVS